MACFLATSRAAYFGIRSAAEYSTAGITTLCSRWVTSARVRRAGRRESVGPRPDSRPPWLWAADAVGRRRVGCHLPTRAGPVRTRLLGLGPRGGLPADVIPAAAAATNAATYPRHGRAPHQGGLPRTKVRRGPQTHSLSIVAVTCKGCGLPVGAVISRVQLPTGATAPHSRAGPRDLSRAGLSCSRSAAGVDEAAASSSAALLPALPAGAASGHSSSSTLMSGANGVVGACAKWASGAPHMKMASGAGSALCPGAARCGACRSGGCRV